jgi:hypothetical protein
VCVGARGRRRAPTARGAQVFQYDCVHVAHPGLLLINGKPVQPQFLASSEATLQPK